MNKEILAEIKETNKLLNKIVNKLYEDKLENQDDKDYEYS